MKGYVTHQFLIGILLTFTAAIGGGVIKYVSDNRHDADVRIELLTVRVDRHKGEVDAGQAELRKDVQAIYQYMLTKQRQPRLEKK